MENSQVLAKLLGSKITGGLYLNEQLENYYQVRRFLGTCEIKYLPWQEDIAKYKHYPLRMTFTDKCNLRQVYQLAFILKDCGLVHIAPAINKRKSGIYIGDYAREDVVMVGEHRYHGDVFMALTLNDFFRNYHPKMSAKLARYSFPYTPQYKQFEQQAYPEELEPTVVDWRRETFDALTDGQLGSYDDFDGDIDDVKDWAGY